jgi:hypothetical protein
MPVGIDALGAHFLSFSASIYDLPYHAHHPDRVECADQASLARISISSQLDSSE